MNVPQYAAGTLHQTSEWNDDCTGQTVGHCVSVLNGGYVLGAMQGYEDEDGPRILPLNGIRVASGTLVLMLPKQHALLLGHNMRRVMRLFVSLRALERLEPT